MIMVENQARYKKIVAAKFFQLFFMSDIFSQ
jgi:hypothetical protein